MRKLARVAAVQLEVGPDAADNLARASALVARAATAEGCDLICLPECFVGLYGVAHFARWAEPLAGAPLARGAAMMSAAALAHGAYVAGGIVEEEAAAPPGGGGGGGGGAPRLFNTIACFGPDGRLAARYRKVWEETRAGRARRPRLLPATELRNLLPSSPRAPRPLAPRARLREKRCTSRACSA